MCVFLPPEDVAFDITDRAHYLVDRLDLDTTVLDVLQQAFLF